MGQRSALFFGAVAVSALWAAASTASTAPSQTSARFCLLVVEETAGRLAIADPHGGVLKRLTLGERPHEVEVSADGNTAYVSMFGITDYDSQLGKPGTSVAKIDLLRGERVGDYQLPDDLRAPHGVKLRPPQFRELYVNAEKGGDTMLVFDTKTSQLLRRFPLPPGSHNFVFSADGAAIFSFAGANGVAKIDAASGKVLATRNVGSPVRGVVMASDGSVLAGAKGAVVELAAADLSEIRRWPTPGLGQFVYLDQLPNGSIVAPSLNDDGVMFLPADGDTGRFVATGKTAIRALRGPDDLVYVANVLDDHVSVLGPDGSVRRPVPGVTSPNGLNFGACPRP
jgi:DNA-binding beta-propeller fold protein YncE